MVVRYPNQCDPPELPPPTCPTESRMVSNKKAQTKKSEVSITSNPNRDVLVIRISEAALRDLKQLRKVEVHLGLPDLGIKRAPPPRSLDTAPLRDALLCNIYKEMKRAKLAEAAKIEDVKRKMLDENWEEYRDTKRLKPESSPHMIDVPKASKVPKKEKCEEYPEAKPIPYFAFILSAIVLGFIYMQVNDPIKDLEDVRWKNEDLVAPADPQMWRPVRIAQDILRIFPEDSPFLKDPHVFWRANLEDPKVRFLLRWISQTMWRRRRRGTVPESGFEIQGQSESGTVGTILDNLVDEPTQALAVIEPDRWIDLRYPVEVTTIAWNILIDFVFYWLTD